MVVPPIYFCTRSHVCAPNYPGTVNALQGQKLCLLLALEPPMVLSALHTVGTPELPLTDGCNESLNCLMSQWTTEWCNHTADCLNLHTLGGKPRPTQDAVMVL